MPNLITASDYNQIRDNFESVMGINSQGYGVTNLLTLPAVPRRVVGWRDWSYILKGLNYIVKHQSGVEVQWNGTATFDLNLAPNRVGNLKTGTQVLSSFTNFLNVQASQAAAVPQRYSVHPSQLGSLNSENGVSIRTSSWNSMNHLVRVSWLTTATAQYFFNLGGRIEIDAESLGGGSSADDSAWDSILGSLIASSYSRSDYVGSEVKYYPSVTGSGGYSGYSYDIVATRSQDQRSVTFNISFNTVDAPPAPVTTSSLIVFPGQATWTVGGADPDVVTVGIGGAGSYGDAGVGNSSISLSLNSDGSLVVQGSNRGVLLSSSWVSTVVAGVGSRYWVRFTLQSSSGNNERSTSPSTGWINLSSGASVVASAVGINLRGNSDQQSRYLVEVSGDGGSTVASSAVFNLSALATANLFSPVNPLPSSGSEFREVDVGQIEVVLTFSSNGEFLAKSTTRREAGVLEDILGSGNWGVPSTEAAGLGYWIRIQQVSDSSSGGGSSSSSPSTGWVNLGSGFSFGVVATASGLGNRVHISEYSVSIAVDSNGTNIVASGSYILHAESVPAPIISGGGGFGGGGGGFFGGTIVVIGGDDETTDQQAADDGTTQGINDIIAENYLYSIGAINPYIITEIEQEQQQDTANPLYEPGTESDEGFLLPPITYNTTGDLSSVPEGVTYEIYEYDDGSALVVGSDGSVTSYGPGTWSPDAFPNAEVIDSGYNPYTGLGDEFNSVSEVGSGYDPNWDDSSGEGGGGGGEFYEAGSGSNDEEEQESDTEGN